MGVKLVASGGSRNIRQIPLLKSMLYIARSNSRIMAYAVYSKYFFARPATFPLDQSDMSWASRSNDDLERRRCMCERINARGIDGRRWIFGEVKAVKKPRKRNEHIPRTNMPPHANTSSYKVLMLILVDRYLRLRLPMPKPQCPFSISLRSSFRNRSGVKISLFSNSCSL